LLVSIAFSIVAELTAPNNNNNNNKCYLLVQRWHHVMKYTHQRHQQYVRGERGRSRGIPTQSWEHSLTCMCCVSV
jgi:hypothetical protein